MSPVGAKPVELEKYLRLLKSFSPAVEGLFFVDVDGDTYDARPGRRTGSGVALARLTPEQWHAHAGGSHSHEWHGGMAIRREVTSDAGELLGWLIIRLNVGPEQEKLVAGMRDSLSRLVDCVSVELQLGRDVESLTNELIERYEELNLVYKTARQEALEEDCADALEQLVRNCRDHLGNDFVALVVPDKGIEVHAGNGNTPIGDLPGLLDIARGRLMGWAGAHRTALVINSSSSALRDELCPQLSCKILAAPLADNHGETIGLLLMANHPYRPDFSNSDRNLASVMAGKAAKTLLASHDPLTGLITRDAFEYLLASAVAMARSQKLPSSVLHVNIDQIHVFNDTLGRKVGDEIIRQVAVRLRNELRGSDTVARLAGDEFGVLLHTCTPDRARHVADKLRALVADTVFSADGHELRATVSIGVASLSDQTESVVSALSDAEVACAAASESGRNSIRLYEQDDPKLTQRQEQMHWVGRLRDALDKDSFVLYGQLIEPLRPRVDTSHVEVLLRMRGENASLLPPASFIPAAERYHLMSTVDRWVVRNTLQLLEQHRDNGFLPDVVSINLSGQTLGDSEFLQYLVDELRPSPEMMGRICFEITETAAIANIDDARRFMDALKKLGCRFALDDFGAGLSSFAYLKDLPVDYLKIDGCFVREIADDRISQSIVAAINHVGHSLGLATIAEYVESDAIKRKLTDLGVDHGQGFGIEEPRPLESHLVPFLEGKTAAVS